MIEIALAALVPSAFLWLIARARSFDDSFRAAVSRWFIPLTLLWFSPCFLTGRSNAPFDYLAEDVWPWKQAGHDIHAGNALLSDAVLQFLPWREVWRDSILHGSMPFRNPFAASGAALWENPQAAVAFPLTFIGLPFSTFAWPLFASVAKLLIALSGMYLFLRAERSSHHAAIFGAIAYAFCAFNIVFLLFPHTNVTATFPLLMLALSRVSSSGRAAAGLAIALATLLTGGHPESVLHCAVVALPFGVRAVIRSDRRSRTAGRIILGGVAGMMVAAPILIPFAEYLPYTERIVRLRRQQEIVAVPKLTASNASAFVVPAHLLNTRNPDLLMNFNEVASQYAGLLTFALALAAGFVAPRQNRFWVVLWIVATLLAFESFVTPLLFRLPLFNITVHGRMRFAIAFVMATLAAAVIDRLSDLQGRRAAAVSVAVCAAAAVLTFIGDWPRFQHDGMLGTAALSAGIAAAGAVIFLATMSRRDERLQRVIPILLFADLAALLLTYNSPVSRVDFLPVGGAAQYLRAHSGSDRVTGILNALRPNSAAMLGLHDIAFHDPTAFEPYGQALQRAGYERRYYFNFFRDIPPRAVLEYLGVRYVVAPSGFVSGALPAVYRGPDATIFENPRVLRRIVSRGPATISIHDERQNRIRVEISAAGPTALVTSETALPGWRLERNGTPWPLRREVFLGWDAPAGTSRFDLIYEPVGFRLGCVLAIAGLLVIVALATRSRAEVGPDSLK